MNFSEINYISLKETILSLEPQQSLKYEAFRKASKDKERRGNREEFEYVAMKKRQFKEITS